MRRLIITAFILAQALLADQVTLKNGDRISGNILKYDGKNLVLKSDLAGEVVIPWENVTGVTSTQPLNVTLKDGQRVVGMFTERDVLRRVVAEMRDPATTLVEEVMTTDVACAQAHTTLDEAAGVMKNRRIRHLPVFDEEDRLEGLISIGDLNAWKTDGQETTIRFLSEYIHGRA